MLHSISGTAGTLGGLGLSLPALTRIQTHLVVWAAAGLATVMAFIAHGRARLAPLRDRKAA